MPGPTDADNTHFLNVDLELVAGRPVTRLLQALAPDTLLLRDSTEGGCRTVWLELAGTEPVDTNDAILRYVGLVRALPSDARAAWDACEDRCANVGIQAGRTPHATALRLSAEAVAGLAEIAARLEITVYGSEGSATRTDVQVPRSDRGGRSRHPAGG